MRFARQRLVALVFIFATALVALFAGAKLCDAVEEETFTALSEEEKAFLQEHPVIRVGLGTAFPPVMYFDEDEQAFQGMIVDYLHLLEKRLGVTFSPVAGISFKEALNLGREKTIDLFPAISMTPERSAFLDFTDPYLAYPLVIVTRNDMPLLGGVEDLQSFRIGLVKALATYSKLINDFSHIEFDFVFHKTVPEVLASVSVGTADACIVNLAVAVYEINRQGLGNLKIAAHTPWETNQLRMGVRDDWPLLKSVLQKTLADLPASDVEAIRKKWIGLKNDQDHIPDEYERYVVPFGFSIAFFLILLVVWVIALRREVKRREDAETALVVSESRFRNVLENADRVAVQGYDQQRRVFYWNKASERLYGYSVEEVLGAQLEELIIPEQMRPEVIRFVDDWMENDIPIPSGELELQHKNGSLIPVYSSHVLLENSRGLKEMYCIDVDLSEIRRTHNQLLEAKKQAELANKSKSEFLANMSHEIRTPMNGIIGMLQLLQLSNLDAEQEDYSTKAIISAQRLTRLLADILDLSRVEAGRMDIADTVFSLSECMNTTRDLFEPMAKNKNLGLVFNISAMEQDNFVGDQLRLQQVLNNFIGNAIKFSDSGYVHVGVDPLTALRDGESRLLFSISDSGIGMSDEIIEHIFEPFRQAEGEYHRRYQGAGLGLTISKQLLSLMGCGNLCVDSMEGVGTKVYFSLALPMADAIEVESTIEKSGESELPGGLNVLVVEDDTISMEVITAALGTLGHAYSEAINGQQALEKIQDHDFDVILMDIHMPILDGVEATRLIRRGGAGERNTLIPIVALTAYAMIEDPKKFIDAGMSDYLSKPIDIEKLGRVLSRAVKDVIGE